MFCLLEQLLTQTSQTAPQQMTLHSVPVDFLCGTGPCIPAGQCTVPTPVQRSVQPKAVLPSPRQPCLHPGTICRQAPRELLGCSYSRLHQPPGVSLLLPGSGWVPAKQHPKGRCQKALYLQAQQLTPKREIPGLGPPGLKGDPEELCYPR